MTTATIDGIRIDVLPGDTILAAATRSGVGIPTLCHVPGLAAEGGCRVCSVSVDGVAGLVAACHQPLRDGMVVRTATPDAKRLRRDLLEWIVAERGYRPRPGADSEFDRLLERHGVAAPPADRRSRIDDGHPYLRYDADACILCRRCIHAADEIQGCSSFSVRGRGGSERLWIGARGDIASSPCVACGACVDRCPTGALHDTDREAGRIAERTTQTVCGYCGVGCRIEVATGGGAGAAITGVAGAAVNRGHLCAKGRYAHGYRGSGDRLVAPLVRRGEGFVRVGWADAIAEIAARLGEVAGRHGAASLGAMTSSRSTNEAAYLLQKLVRSVLGSNNVDSCARVCHSSTALALGAVTGTGAASASYADIERAKLIVVAGANATEAHPVIGARIRQAALRGTPLIVVDPRAIELAEVADVHLALTPGTNVALFNAIAKRLVSSRRVDAAYLAERCCDVEIFEYAMERLDLDANAAACGVPLAAIDRAAALLGEAGPTLFVHGLGLSELTQGVDSVIALANIALLTGSIGRMGAGMLPLRGQNNVQGNADMGSMPDRITGYQPLDDDGARARMQRLWGTAPPPEPGLTQHEMLDAAGEGRIRALWVQGEDLVQAHPMSDRVRDQLAALDLLVVQELFMTETAQLAHVVLPAAAALEQDGTFTNGERRIQRVRAAADPPGDARPDWIVVRDVARALGAKWTYEHPADVMNEIAALAPDSFGGVDYDRLDADGLQWPCPSRDHPGTATVHADGFAIGRAHLIPVEHEPNPEHGHGAFPYLLITGRVLEHYNVGSMTRRTRQLVLAPGDRLEIHPSDSAREGIGDGALVALESRWGKTAARARVTRRVQPGTLFLSFHFPETHTNCLIGPHVDPKSKCPQFKVTAVRIAAEAAGSDPPAIPGT